MIYKQKIKKQVFGLLMENIMKFLLVWLKFIKVLK